LSGKQVEGFGSGGGDFKEFKKPSGLYVYDGIIYVADYGNDRVQVFGPNGVFLKAITGHGGKDTPDQLIKAPTGVGVDHRGYVYVTCAAADGIKIFLPNGELYHKLEDGGSLSAIAMSRDGFYVADQDGFCIKKYDHDGKRLFSFGSKGDGRTQFGSISDICVDTGGKVYVADPVRGMIHVFSPQQGKEYAEWQKMPPPTLVTWVEDINLQAGKTVWAGRNTLFAVEEKTGSIIKIKDGQVIGGINVADCTPASIALDKAGTLWVLDREEKRVLRIDDQGEIRSSFGSSGELPGQFSKPSDIAITSMGVIYVSDLGNRWVQAFSSDGLLLNVFREGKEGSPFVAPSAIALDRNDVLYVLDRERCTVTAFAPEGNFLSEFGKRGEGKGELDDPVSLFATTSEIFVLDAEICSIKVFSPEGSFLGRFGTRGKGKGDFKNPSAISAMNGKTFFVSDSGNKRIQVLEYTAYPSPPVDMVAEGRMHAIGLSWRKNPESCVSSYHIYRSENPDGPFVKISHTDTFEYLDTDVELKKTYYYLVSAMTDTGMEGGKGNVASAEPTKYLASMPSDLKATAGQCSVSLSWAPSKEGFVIGYAVSREVDGGQKIVGTTETPRFSENFLASDTPYTYWVAAVSSDGSKSNPASITTTTTMSNRPPFEVHILEMKDVFSHAYEFYETRGIGRIRLANNTCEPISGIKVSFMIKEFMDLPWEMEIDGLPPNMDRELDLKAVFNDNILNSDEYIQVKAEIKVLYYKDNEARAINISHRVNIYEKHHIKWDEKKRFAAFITPNDAMLLEFVRSIMAQYGDAFDNIQRAAVVFEALGVTGLTYVKEQGGSSQMTSGMTDSNDHVQYPRETLHRKSGDCDDLVALYAAALETIGIKTLVVGNPEHMLIMFSSGIADDGSGYTMDGMFVVHEGRLWIPVETTLVGHSFIRAWEEGSRKFHAFQGNNSTLLDVHDSWETFKPTALPASFWEPDRVSREVIEERFRDELKTLRKIVVQFRGKKYVDILSEDPDDMNALMQLAIIKARAGETQEAFKILLKLLKIDPKNAAALNNIGNIHFLEGRYEDARDAYKMAADLEPQDAFIWVNLARCCQWLNLIPEARDCFSKARALNPSVSKRFRAMSLELLGKL